jgi:hypothetical protein
MTENATIIRVDEDHASGIWRSILIYVWRLVTRPEVVDEHQKYITKLVAGGPGPLAMMIVCEAKSEMPDAPTRTKLAGTLDAMAKVATCAAMVHEGTGFRGAAVRGVVTLLNTVARQPFPYKSFGTVDAAANWMLTIHDDGKGRIPVVDLVGVVSRLRTLTR